MRLHIISDMLHSKVTVANWKKERNKKRSLLSQLMVPWEMGKCDNNYLLWNIYVECQLSHYMCNPPLLYYLGTDILFTTF